MSSLISLWNLAAAIGTAKQIKKLERTSIKKIMILGIRSTLTRTERIIEESLTDFPVLGHMSFNPKVLRRTGKEDLHTIWMKKLRMRWKVSLRSWRKESNG